MESIADYIASLYAEQDNLTRQQFIDATELQDFIPVVDDDVARLLKVLIRLTQARRVLEIGASIGYSATSMAYTLRDYGGNIITVEFDEEVAR